MTHLSVRRGALALAAAATLAAVAAPQASAKQLSCGATITKDTKLTKDLVNCPGVGIRIGADDITLDLNGHTVAAAAKRNPKAHGILNKGHDHVTIKGGTVKGFGAYGVRLADAKRNVVRNMHMTGNFTGIGLVESSNNLVEHSDMSGSRFVGVNLTGAFLGMKTVHPSMRRAGGGAIVNVSSMAAYIAVAPASAYTASKWGLRGLTKAAAIEFGPDRIRVNSLHPGMIKTPMIEGASDEATQSARYPIPRFGTSEEVAATMLHIVCDATYSTGSEFCVDGGILAGISVGD